MKLPSCLARMSGVTMLVMALTTLGCTTSRESVKPEKSPGLYILEVGNSSAVGCDIYLGPALLLRVDPGNWGSLPNLPRSRSQFEARCGDKVIRRELNPDAALHTWIIGENQSSLSPAPGQVQLVNPTSQDFEGVLDMTPFGRIQAGSERLIPGCEPGPHQLKLLDVTGRGQWIETLEVVPGQIAILVLDPAVTDLTLRNETDEPIIFMVGEKVRERLSPGENRALKGFSPGTWKISAELLRSRRTVVSTVELSSAQAATWGVSSDLSSLEIINESKEPMEILVQDRPAGTVEPGGKLTLENLPAGETRLKAKGRTTGIIMEKHETLLAGAMHSWALAAKQGTIRITNDFNEPMELYIDSVPSMSLTPGEEVTLSLSRGSHQIAWRGTMAKDFQKADIQVDPNKPQVLSLGPGRSRIRLVNLLTEAVSVYRDSEYQVSLAGGEEAILCGLVGGKYLLEAVGEGVSAQVHRENVVLETGETGLWEIRPRVFSLELTNTSGEALVPVGLLRGRLETLAPDQQKVLDLPRGKFNLELLGESTTTSYSRDVDGTSGEPVSWLIPKPQGTIKVTNSTQMEIEVYLAGKAVGKVKTHEVLQLKDLRPGVYAVSARGPRGSLGSKNLLVSTGETTNWDINAVFASLRVVNRTRDELELLVNNQPSGKIAALGETTLGNLPLTPVDIQARHPRTGASQAVRISPTVEDPPTWYIDPVSGQLKVEGFGDRAGTLNVGDGAPLAFARGTKPFFLSLDPGWYTVKVQLEGENTAHLQRIQIFQAQTTVVNLDDHTFKLIISNQTPATLVLTDRGARIGIAPAGQRTEIPGLTPGEHSFQLAGEKKGEVPRWLLKRIHFRGGRIYNWSIPGEAQDR